MDETNLLFKNPTFFIVCLLVIMTPMLRGSVHLWAETLIQMLALTGVCIVVLEKHIFFKGKSALGSGRNTESWVMGPVFFLAVISGGVARSQSLAMEGFVMLLTYLAIFYITLYAVRHRKEQRILVYVIIGTALFLSFFAMLKQFDMNPMGLWLYPEILRPGDPSLTGPYVNRNHLAGFLEMAIPLLLGLFLTRERSHENLLAMIGLVLFLIIAQAMTLSRGGWAATFMSLILMMAALLLSKEFKQKRLLISIFISVLVVGIIVLASTPVIQRITTLTQHDTSDNLAGRMKIWRETVSLIKDNLWMGVGPGNFKEVYPAYQTPGDSFLAVYAHNDYLHFIAESGILGVPVMLWLLYLFFRAGLRKLKHPSRQTRGIALGGMGAIIAVLIHSYSDFNLHIPANIILFTVISCLVMVGKRRERRV